MYGCLIAILGLIGLSAMAQLAMQFGTQGTWSPFIIFTVSIAVFYLIANYEPKNTDAVK